MIICKHCNNDYEITAETLIDERIEITKGGKTEIMRLTYLQCPKCGEIKPVILDNKQSLYYVKRKLDAKTKDTRAKHEERLKNIRLKIINEWQGGLFELAGIAHKLEINPNEEIAP